MDLRTVTCTGCKKGKPLESMRFVAKGNERIMLCPLCRKTQGFHEPTSGQNVPDVHAVPANPATKVDYKCLRCKFSFKHSPKSTSKLMCPYCGKSDQVFDSTF